MEPDNIFGSDWWYMGETEVTYINDPKIGMEMYKLNVDNGTFYAITEATTGGYTRTNELSLVFYIDPDSKLLKAFGLHVYRDNLGRSKHYTVQFEDISKIS